MKRRDYVDDDGDRVLIAEWGNGRKVRASLGSSTQPPAAWTHVETPDATVYLGDVDADDAQALALLFADLAAALKEADDGR